jgi:hypothetical protein
LLPVFALDDVGHLSGIICPKLRIRLAIKRLHKRENSSCSGQIKELGHYLQAPDVVKRANAIDDD